MDPETPRTTLSSTESITWGTAHLADQSKDLDTQHRTQWTLIRHQGPCRLERTGSRMSETPTTQERRLNAPYLVDKSLKTWAPFEEHQQHAKGPANKSMLAQAWVSSSG